MAEQKLTTRAAVAACHLQLIALLETVGFTEDSDLSDLTVTINYRTHRMDITKATDNGQHFEWLCAFSIDPRDLPAFGTPVGLPGMDRQTH